MKIGKEGYFDLTYCSNIHGGESWSKVFTNMKTFLPPLKADLAADSTFGIGLRLSNRAVGGLLKDNNLQELKEWLLNNQFYIMTINAFPYGNFHRKGMKDRVYAPDWTSRQRRDYSLKIAQVLAEITPDGGESGFSTSPLSYKPWLNSDKTAKVFKQSAIYLSEVAAAMAHVYDKSGTLIHIDIEAEPDCLIETTSELITFFEKWLIPIGTSHISQQEKISLQQAEEQLRRHVQVCYDICHSCVEFENPVDVFNDLAKADIKIGKIQVSAALKCKFDNQDGSNQQAMKNLFEFIDPVYLHQVIKRNTNNKLTHELDLNALVLESMDSSQEELRTHFHVPIFLEHYEHLDSTQSDIITVLKLLQSNKATRHLEIETYTWDVLPSKLKTDLFSSIKREYEWVMSQF